jgi:hypothetical protein
MDELFASGMKFAYFTEYNTYYNVGVESEVSKIYRNLVNCQSYWKCLRWAMYHKSVSILCYEDKAEFSYTSGKYVGENSKPLVCKLEDGVIIPVLSTMLMFPGDPLMRRVNVIIDRVVEAGLYNHWFSVVLSSRKARNKKIAIVQQFNEYYSFNLNHMQITFYFLFMG